MGEGGFLTPPASFFQTVRQLCDEHGIMLILDEVPSCGLAPCSPCHSTPAFVVFAHLDSL